MNLSRSRTLRVGVGAVVAAAALLTTSPIASSPSADAKATAVTTKAPAPTPLVIPEEMRNQRITWQSCGLPIMTGTMKCAAFAVPRDWNNLAERIYIPIAVSLHTPAKGTGSRAIALNPGGPGGPGLEMPILFQDIPSVLDDTYLIGFDPRGVRLSATMDCGSSPMYSVNYRSRLPQAIKSVKSESTALLDRCAYYGGRAPVGTGRANLTPVINTEQTVKDIEAMRQILTPVKKLDFVGYSGGTWMGAMYQAYFPQQAGRMVLDSVADFTDANWHTVFRHQPLGFERRFKEDFLVWAAKHNDVYGLGSTPEEAYKVYDKMHYLLAAVEGKLESAFFGMTIPVRFDPNIVDDVIPGYLYDKGDWPALASLMMPWAQNVRDYERSNGPIDLSVDPSNEAGVGGTSTKGGTTTKVNTMAAVAAVKAALSDPLMVNALKGELGAKSLLRPNAPAPVDVESSTAVFYQLTCNDSLWPRTEDMMAESAALGKQYPLVGWGFGFWPCGQAPAPARELIKPKGDPLNPVLLVQSEHDPATAFEGAWHAHQNMAGSHLIKVTNNGNHGIFLGEVGCVNNAGLSFLATGVLPQADADNSSVCDGRTSDPSPWIVKPQTADAAPDGTVVSRDGKSPLTYLSEVVAQRTPAQNEALFTLANPNISAQLGN